MFHKNRLLESFILHFYSNFYEHINPLISINAKTAETISINAKTAEVEGVVA